MVDVKPGSRFRSAVCEAEVVVVKAPAGDVDLRLGGHPVAPVGDAPGDALEVVPGFDGGCLMGKRYADESGSLELLCTKPGTGALSVADDLLEVKGAKPLPSSD